ncbi:stage II sporulation protein R [Gracilibacillus marinus]|uniref:Stage II sporulation protein R n=1 Tax=Gracilibacillus marinus TaxID=630535 RepID=A0ABV8VT93_9BACI
MKKLILFLGLIFLIIGFFPQKVTSESSMDVQVIPDEAIRLRILANSDTEEDQTLKHQVRDAINEEVTKWVEKMDQIEDARALIASRVDVLEQIVDNVLVENQSDYTYTVEYNKNVTFPAKLYGNYLYPEGEYEAILVTLGEGDGSNWWCVVFPPLCFLDFSFGTTVDEEEKEADEQEEVEEEEEEVTYTFFLVEWFKSWI